MPDKNIISIGNYFAHVWFVVFTDLNTSSIQAIVDAGGFNDANTTASLYSSSWNLWDLIEATM